MATRVLVLGVVLTRSGATMQSGMLERAAAAAAAAGPSRHTRQHYVIPSSLTAHEGRRDVLPNILSHHKYAHTYCSRVISRVTAA